jgi:hypothetical protein
VAHLVHDNKEGLAIPVHLILLVCVITQNKNLPCAN